MHLESCNYFLINQGKKRKPLLAFSSNSNSKKKERKKEKGLETGELSKVSLSEVTWFVMNAKDIKLFSSQYELLETKFIYHHEIQILHFTTPSATTHRSVENDNMSLCHIMAILMICN